VGFGIQNKHSMVFFGVAIVLAILLTPLRRQFAQKWIWLGGLIALVIALPNIIWQINRGWPTWVLLHAIAKSNKNVVLSPVGIFLPTDYLDESVDLSAVVWWVNLAARLPRRPALPRHRFHLLNRSHRIRRHAREELLPCPGLSDVICGGWHCFRGDFRAALALAQSGDCVSRRRVSGHLRTGRSPHFITGEIARLYARDSFRGPTNGNVACCGITPTLCRPIRLGGDGALSCAGLRQLACE